jgi:hypothetical protein
MRSVCLFCLVVLLGGCAFTDMKLPLPVKGLDPTVAGGGGREVVVTVPFADDRGVKRCGMKKNGYNMDTADIVCQGDPALWLGKLFADELRASGFRVLGADDARKPSAVRLDGGLLTVFVEPVIGAWSGSLETDLQVKLVATSDTGLRAERVFFVKGAKKGLMVVTDQPVQTAFHRATQDLLREMVQAVFELMLKYPQLGGGEIRSGRAGAAG